MNATGTIYSSSRKEEETTTCSEGGAGQAQLNVHDNAGQGSSRNSNNNETEMKREVSASTTTCSTRTRIVQPPSIVLIDHDDETCTSSVTTSHFRSADLFRPKIYPSMDSLRRIDHDATDHDNLNIEAVDNDKYNNNEKRLIAQEQARFQNSATRRLDSNRIGSSTRSSSSTSTGTGTFTHLTAGVPNPPDCESEHNNNNVKSLHLQDQHKTTTTCTATMDPMVFRVAQTELRKELAKSQPKAKLPVQQQQPDIRTRDECDECDSTTPAAHGAFAVPGTLLPVLQRQQNSNSAPPFPGVTNMTMCTGTSTFDNLRTSATTSASSSSTCTSEYDCENLVQATPVDTDEALQQALPVPVPVPGPLHTSRSTCANNDIDNDNTAAKKHLHRRSQQQLVALIVTAVVILGILLILLIPQKQQQQQNPDTTPSNHSITTIATTTTPSLSQDSSIDPIAIDIDLPLVIENLSTTTVTSILQDLKSPQRAAYQWLLQDPYRDQYTNDRLLQRFALATWYFSTNGNETKTGRGWSSSNHWLEYDNNNNTLSSECDWDHLQCAPPTSDTQQVEIISLNFQNRDLSGTIPPEMGLLTSLVALSLGGHFLTGTIPSELAVLSQLQMLDLSAGTLQDSARRRFTDFTDPTLSGTLPSELALLTNLKGLAVAFNYQLHGTIPTHYGRLTQLRGLYLLDTNLSGSIPSQLGRCTNLVWLRMEHSRLSGTIPTELGLMASSLKYLVLDGNRPDGEHQGGFVGAIPSELGLLTQLRRLGLCCNSLTGIVPEQLWQQLTNLEGLAAQRNYLTGSLTSMMGYLTSLQYLAVGKNMLTSVIPSEIGLLTGLKELWLQENFLTATIPNELWLLSNLTVLTMHGNALELASSALVVDSDIDGNKSSSSFSRRRYVHIDDNQGVVGTCSAEVDPNLPCHAFFDPAHCQCNSGMPESAESTWVD